MSVITTTEEHLQDRLYRALRQEVAQGPAPLGRLLAAVAEREQADIEVVLSAMWDLVETGEFNYGMDARVTAAA